MKARLAALLFAALPGMAHAQAYQCRVPERIGSVPAPSPDGPTRHARVDGYTLAASWSPEYCRMTRDTTSMQCSGRQGRFGFILHGLWPEARGGAPPQWCAPTPAPPPDLVRRNLCMTPAPGLLAREWAKHGTCMVKTPQAYFKVSGILWNSIRWPDADRLSRNRDLTAGDFRRAFVEANPDWKASQVGIVASRTGWLREVYLCYGRNFMPTACTRRAYGPADSAQLKIWRGL
ncbi:MAG: ribonuclease T [Novosphingobium sp.]|nr:ribonuclease T [Novosphingobium sp.]